MLRTNKVNENTNEASVNDTVKDPFEGKRVRRKGKYPEITLAEKIEEELKRKEYEEKTEHLKLVEDFYFTQKDYEMLFASPSEKKHMIDTILSMNNPLLLIKNIQYDCEVHNKYFRYEDAEKEVCNALKTGDITEKMYYRETGYELIPSYSNMYW